MARLREISGCDVDGILGTPSLKTLVFQIDFDRGRLDFLEPSAARTMKRGESIPLVYSPDRLIFILATVAKDRREPFQIDTGYLSTGCLSVRTFDDLAGARQLHLLSRARRATLLGDESSRCGRLCSLTVGSFQHKDLVFFSASRNTLGLPYLARFRVTIDLPGETMYITKSKRFGEPDVWITSGLQVCRRNGRVEVESVDEDGPADEAGVREGDIIVTIQGKAASELTLFGVRCLLHANEKTPIRMTVERGGKTLDLAFRVKDL